MEDCRIKAQAALTQQKPTNWVAAVIIVLIWLTVAGALGWWLWRLRNPILSHLLMGVIGLRFLGQVDLGLRLYPFASGILKTRVCSDDFSR